MKSKREVNCRRKREKSGRNRSQKGYIGQRKKGSGRNLVQNSAGLKRKEEDMKNRRTESTTLEQMIGMNGDWEMVPLTV